MATAQEMRALLATPCPHCGAVSGSTCRVKARGRKGQVLWLPITTLDGGCHDARWQAALGRPAAVRSDVVAARHPRRVAPSPRMARGTVAVLDPPPKETPDDPDRPW